MTSSRPRSTEEKDIIDSLGEPPPQPDFSDLPSTYVLPTHLSEAELHDIEDELLANGAPLTYDIKEAKLVLTEITQKRRAKLELKWGKVSFDEGLDEEKWTPASGASRITKHKKRKLGEEELPPLKSIKSGIDGSRSTYDSFDASTTDEEDVGKQMPQLALTYPSTSPTARPSGPTNKNESGSSSLEFFNYESRVQVVHLDWFHDCFMLERSLPFDGYIIYEARILPPGQTRTSQEPVHPRVFSEPTRVIKASTDDALSSPESILARANIDAQVRPKSFHPQTRKRDYVKEAADHDFSGRSFASSKQTSIHSSRRTVSNPPKLVRQSTSELDEDIRNPLPNMPDWVNENKIYSCERATPLHSPNETFISELEKIKLARLLTADEVGVRAYSTSIASLRAYPHIISSPREILALPGCDQKIAHLFQEWHTSGQIQAVRDLEADPVLRVLRLFHEIWGVGALTAREFYYGREWRDLDDIVEQGWKSLTRVQQIGIKYYDEFQLKIPRAEVESIAATVAAHARRLTDSKLEAIIVGGYRRGKSESGDVDIILSHPSEPMTKDLILDVTASLEAAGCITHTLTLALTNSNRDQQPLPFASGPSSRSHSFDSLDKALVVWQDPAWPSKPATDRAANADPASNKNPNPHRRVDIIISPWRTVGCAVAGWTSGTTFQRDLRRYAKKVKGWKFDSSGVRERGSGKWLDLEGWADEATRCRSWLEAERRVFAGLGLVYREPWERCTG